MNENNNRNMPPNSYLNDSGDTSTNKKVYPSANGAYMIPDTDYSHILNSYQHIAKKERSIQIIGGVFAFLSFIIELVVFLIVKPLLNNNIPLGVIARFIWIFIVLLIINAFTIVQLIIIFRWNNNVEKVKEQHQTLAITNYKMINQISLIIFTTISILVSILAFFWFYSQYTVPPRPDRLITFLRIYSFLRRLAMILILVYAVFEIWQLIKWVRRRRAITRIEQKILEDLPKLNELVDLTKTYVVNNSSDGENEENGKNEKKEDNDENQTFIQT